MSLDTLSPEARILLLAAGGAQNDAGLRKLLHSPMDWGKLSWLAELERASPVLWHRLNAVDRGALPPEASALQRLAMVSEFRMLHLEQRVVETIDALSRAGLEGMLLKGAALAVTVYGSFARRPMIDLDLLVAPEMAARARTVLLDVGWAPGGKEQAMAEFYEGHQHLAALDDARGTGVRLELHTGLFFAGHPFNLPISDVWRRSRRAALHAHRVRVPSREDELLHLCLHFAWSHMMANGAWRAVRDLGALVATREIDWSEFTRLAVQSRGATCCYWTFRLARALSGVAVPEEVVERMRPPQPEWMLRRLEQHFTHYILPTETMCPSVAVAYSMWRMAVRPGWSGHGAVRPWDRSAALLSPAPEPGYRRAVSQLRNVRGWARYARLVIT